MSTLDISRRIVAPRSRDLSLDAAVTGMAFLADGTLVVAAGDGMVRLVPPDAAMRELPVHEEGAAALTLAMDLDGRSVLTGGDDGRLMRTSADGTVSTVFHAPGRQIDTIAVSAAGRVRAVATGKQVHLIDHDGAVLRSAGNHPSTVTGLDFHPKGKRLAVSHYGGVTLSWTGTLGHSPTRLGWQGSHIGVSWSPDGSVVMSTMQEAALHGWRPANGDHFQMNGYAAKVRSMDWLAKPMTLFTAGSDCVLAWSFAGRGPAGKPPIELCQGVGRLVTVVGVHPIRPLVAAGFDDGRLALCDIAGEKIVRLRPGDGGRATALAWSSDGRRLAVGTDAGIVSLFNLSQTGSV